MLQCSIETRDTLRRARELVNEIPASDLQALARLRLRMGLDIAALGGALDLDVGQAASLRQRLRLSDHGSKPKRRERGSSSLAG